ncbi:MAG: glycerol-3-phosphate dehydrogenase C-terminal domain-containing protein, partial [Rubrobacteraceae bacterium]
VEYLLASLDAFLPDARLGRETVKFVYSGFRPLLNGDGSNPTAAARDDHIEVSSSGLVSVVGGKLTTARIMAIRVLDRVIQEVGTGAFSRCRTRELSIGGTNEAVAEGLAISVKRYPRLAWYFRVLYGRYGLDAGGICERAAEIHGGGGDPLQAEVEYVCRNEMVCTVEDLIERRAGFLRWSPEKRLERLRYGAPVIRAELDLAEKEFERQFAVYEERLTRFHSLPDATGSGE